MQPRFPRYGNDETIKPAAGQRPASYGLARKQGNDRGRARRSPPPGRWASSQGSTLWYDLEGFDLHQHALPRVRAGVPQRLDHADPRARLRLRRLLQRRVRHQDARRRPGEPARRLRRCPTRSGWPAGTGRPTPARPTSATTAGAPARRMKQYQGGHDETWGGVTDQHRPQLPRRRQGRRSPSRGDPLRRHRGSTSPTTQSLGRRHHGPPRRVKALSACSRSRRPTPASSTAAYNAATVAAVQRLAGGPTGSPVQDIWSRQNWMALTAAGDRPDPEVRLRRPRRTPLQRALNAARRQHQAVGHRACSTSATDTALRA